MATNKKTRNRRRQPFDASKANPLALVSLRDISEHYGYAMGYLYNVRHQMLPQPAFFTARTMRFRWGEVQQHMDRWEKSKRYKPDGNT